MRIQNKRTKKYLRRVTLQTNDPDGTVIVHANALQHVDDFDDGDDFTVQEAGDLTRNREQLFEKVDRRPNFSREKRER